MERSRSRFQGLNSTITLSALDGVGRENAAASWSPAAEPGEPRLYLLKFDSATGSVSMDDAFHDADGKPGFNFANRDWPHGWKGSGVPHGVVFSR